MRQLVKGRYRGRLAVTPDDLRAAQRLRARAFHTSGGYDVDAFDARCQHMLVEEVAGGALVACFRLLHLRGGAEIERSYSAQFYDLTALHGFAAPMVEMGRFCLDPGRHDPDILRVAWGAMTAYVDAHRVEMLFGCSSFEGTDATAYADAFALLRDRHIAPERWRPGIKAPSVIRFAQDQRVCDLQRAQVTMPHLLRTYLLMGGWVSDHAVIDRDMGTLHVFTGLEIAAVPPARARLLRAVAC